MSTPWLIIAENDLNAGSSAGKVAKIRAIATAKAMPDPVPAAITKITAEVRGMINFSGKYALDQNAAKLPPSLIDLVVKKIVRDMSVVVSLPLTEDERVAERTYESRLEKLRKGEWPIEATDTPIDTSEDAPPPATGYYGSDEKVPL